MATTLLPALEAFTTPSTPKAGLADQALLSQVLLLLQTAIKQCAERKEQITPLVDALIPAPSPPDSA